MTYVPNPGPVAPNRMSTIVSVRLDPGVAGELRDLANARGVTLSQLLREGAVAAASEPNVMTIEWITPPAVVTDHGRSVAFTVPEREPRSLVAALDAAITAQQDVIRQLVRAKAQAEKLYDEDEIEPSILDDPIFFPNRQTAQSIKRQIGGE